MLFPIFAMSRELEKEDGALIVNEVVEHLHNNLEKNINAIYNPAYCKIYKEQAKKKTAYFTLNGVDCFIQHKNYSFRFIIFSESFLLEHDSIKICEYYHPEVTSVRDGIVSNRFNVCDIMHHTHKTNCDVCQYSGIKWGCEHYKEGFYFNASH